MITVILTKHFFTWFFFVKHDLKESKAKSHKILSLENLSDFKQKVVLHPIYDKTLTKVNTIRQPSTFCL